MVYFLRIVPTKFSFSSACFHQGAIPLILDEIVALKRLKMEKEKEGFPITSLREINMLLKAGNHPNIVNVRVSAFGRILLYGGKIFMVLSVYT